MNDSQRLADQLERALNGGAWHGPSWRETLEGITAETAIARPIASAHTIAEIVRHAGTWHDVVRRRLEGESPRVSGEDDWDAPPIGDGAAWSLAVDRLFGTGRALVDTIRAFPAARLHEQRPGVDGSWFELISGELQHVLYHAGQIPILRKAADRA